MNICFLSGAQYVPPLAVHIKGDISGVKDKMAFQLHKMGDSGG